MQLNTFIADVNPQVSVTIVQVQSQTKFQARGRVQWPSLTLNGRCELYPTESEVVTEWGDKGWVGARGGGDEDSVDDYVVNVDGMDYGLGKGLHEEWS